MALSESEKTKIEEEEKYRANVHTELHPSLQTKTKKSKDLAAILAIL